MRIYKTIVTTTWLVEKKSTNTVNNCKKKSRSLKAYKKELDCVNTCTGEN